MNNYIIDAMAKLDEQEFISRAGGQGHFHVEHYRPNEFGELELLQILDFSNGITTPGLNALLNVGFQGATQVTAWYIFPISSTSYTALAPSDTMGSHGGWIESIAYSEATRPQWTCGAASGGSMTNVTQMIMTINANSTGLVGMGVAASATKNEGSSTLWATGLFASVQNMNLGDVLKTTYSITLTATN